MDVPNTLGGIGHLPYERDAYWEWCCQYLGYKVPTKKELFKQFGYRPLPKLERMYASRATHRILAGGNRSGKTYGAAWEVIPYLMMFGTKGWIVSANYEMCQALAEEVEKTFVEKLGMKRNIRSFDLSPGEYSYQIREHRFTNWTGSWFQLKSAENPESMHAYALDYVIVDEASLFPYQLYDTRLVPRLVDSGGWILSLGTFEFLQGEWFEEYFEVGQAANDWDIESWKHPTEDNYHLYIGQGGEMPRDVASEYEVSVKKFTRMNSELEWPLQGGEEVYIFNVDLAWLARQKKRIPEVVYRARYGAEPAKNQYLVFPSWVTPKNVNREKAKYEPGQDVYIAVDPGGTYAVAAIQLKALEPPKGSPFNRMTRDIAVCVIDEVYFQTTTETQAVYEECERREWWGDVVGGSIDVAAKEQARVWARLAREREKRLSLMRRKVRRGPGRQTLQHYLETDTFYVNPRCSWLPIEFRRFHWSEGIIARRDTADPRKGRNPVDEWNHLIKAIIYFLVNKFGYFGKGTQGAVTHFRRRRRKQALQWQVA